jgi:hypothetical protein
MVRPASSTTPPNVPVASPIAIRSLSMNRSTAIGTSVPAASNHRLLASIASTPAMKPTTIGRGRSTLCSLDSSSIATAENTTPAAKWSNALISCLPWGRATAAQPPNTIAATGASV